MSKTKIETPKIAGEKNPQKLTGNQGMIVPYYGEFMCVPTALEWSLNYCSHGCSYCFANLNAPTRKGDASKALRQIADIGKRDTLVDHFLRHKYPVCISNKVDPFSESNWREMLPVIQVMKEHGIPIQFQTKGGFGIDEALDGLPPSVWYITVAQDRDAMRKIIEPNAPTIESRIELIQKLVEAGHHVVAAVNPAVPEWIRDSGWLMEQLADAGAGGCWVGWLHLSHKQIMMMPAGSKKALGEALMIRASKKKTKPGPDEIFLEECVQAARGAGMEPFYPGIGDRTEFFAPWRDVYPTTLPTMQDFANFCHDEGYKETDLIGFDEYIEILEGSADPFPSPHRKMRVGDYMRTISLKVVEKFSNWNDYMTFRQLLYIAWMNPGVKLSPAVHGNFAAAVIEEDGEPALLTDDQGRPYYVFDPQGIDGNYRLYTGEVRDD